MKNLENTEIILRVSQFICLCCALLHASIGAWLSMIASIAFIIAIETFIACVHRARKLKATIYLLCESLKLKDKQDTSLSLDTVNNNTYHCDNCPFEGSDCKKLYLVGNKTICVK